MFFYKKGPKMQQHVSDLSIFGCYYGFDFWVLSKDRGGGGNFSLPYLLKICQQFHEKWDIEVRKTILGKLQNFQIEMLLRH